MTPDEARAVLRRHTAPPTEGDATPGFLAMLRPYRGLHEPHFHEIMAALQALAPDLRKAAVDRELMADLWELILLPWLWALAPGGMLQRSQAVSPEDQLILAKWLEEIGVTVSLMLGATEDQAPESDGG
jgi:hypothetical protein